MTPDLNPTSLQSSGGEHQDGAEKTEGKTFLNNLLATLIPEKAPPATMADGGDGGHAAAADGGGQDGEQNGGGGIIGHLISNLVPPGSPRAGQPSSKRKAEVLDFEDGRRGGETDGVSRAKSGGESEAVGDGGGGGGGGVISSLISSFFHSSEEGGGSAAAAGDDEIERHRAAEGGETAAAAAMSEVQDGGGGGIIIIENIVSHLPPSLPEDAAPTTDEASILLHSIVRD